MHYRIRGNKFGVSVFHLVGHMVGTAALFVTVLTLAWLISVFLHYLDSVHKFPPEIYTLTTRIEVWLIWVDVAICGFLVLAGAFRFMREVWRDGR